MDSIQKIFCYTFLYYLVQSEKLMQICCTDLLYWYDAL